MNNIETYEFREHDMTIRGEKHHLIELAEKLRESQAEGTLSDLAYKIEYEFDIDGIRSLDEEYDLLKVAGLIVDEDGNFKSI